MKKLTISILSLVAVAMLVGIAFADPWETFRNVATSRNSIVIGPGFDFTTSAAGTCTLTNGATIPSGKVLTGDVTGTASRIAVGSFIDTSYGLKNSTSNKAQVNLSAKSGLAIGTGSEDGALKIGVGVFEMDIVGGGTPGNFTLTGAALGDELMGVTYFNATTGNVTAISDLTSEFNIPASNVLNQTYGGTSSLNGYLQVLWIDRT